MFNTRKKLKELQEEFANYKARAEYTERYLYEEVSDCRAKLGRCTQQLAMTISRINHKERLADLYVKLALTGIPEKQIRAYLEGYETILEEGDEIEAT